MNCVDKRVYSPTEFAEEIGESRHRGVDTWVVAVVFEGEGDGRDRLIRDHISREVAKVAREHGGASRNIADAIFAVVLRDVSERRITHVNYELRMRITRRFTARFADLGMSSSDVIRAIHCGRHTDQLARLLKIVAKRTSLDMAPIGPPGPVERTHVEEFDNLVASFGVTWLMQVFGRRQPIAVPRRTGGLDAVGAEHFVSLDKLCGRLLPGVRIQDSSAFMTRLDRLVLEHIAADGANTDEEVSMNVAPASLTDCDFRERVAEVAATRRIWLEVPSEAVLDRATGVSAVLQGLRRRGVGILADHATPAGIAEMMASGASVDGFKLSVDGETGVQVDVGRLERDGASVIAIHVEDLAALEHVTAMGVARVQGFLVDERMSWDRAVA